MFECFFEHLIIMGMIVIMQIAQLSELRKIRRNGNEKYGEYRGKDRRIGTEKYLEKGDSEVTGKDKKVEIRGKK